MLAIVWYLSFRASLSKAGRDIPLTLLLFVLVNTDWTNIIEFSDEKIWFWIRFAVLSINVASLIVGCMYWIDRFEWNELELCEPNKNGAYYDLFKEKPIETQTVASLDQKAETADSISNNSKEVNTILPKHCFYVPLDEDVLPGMYIKARDLTKIAQIIVIIWSIGEIFFFVWAERIKRNRESFAEKTGA